jgi:carboxylesterase type B
VPILSRSSYDEPYARRCRPRPTVTTTTGAVRGTRQGGVDRYLGIPYALPRSASADSRCRRRFRSGATCETPRSTARPRRRTCTSARSARSWARSTSPATTS